MTESKFDRIADAFLAPGPTVLPDRVFEAAFAEVHRTRRRRVLWRAPWRFPTMNTFAKAAVAAVAVIAVGLLGLSFLGPDGSGVGGAPSAAPSATVAPTATPKPDPTAPPLTGQFTSPGYGYSIALPEGWTTRAATAPWTTEYVDYFSESGDIVEGEQGFLALASQPLGDRTPAEWEADVWQNILAVEPETAGCPSQAAPITVDGAPGIIACDLVLVTSGGRGYWIRDFLNDDEPWVRVVDRAFFDSMLATMKLNPEDAADGASNVPALTGQLTSERHGYSINYPETWNTRPATSAWTSGYLDFGHAGADVLYEPSNPGNIWLALGSQPLGDRTPAEWEADVWRALIDDDPGSANCSSETVPVAIDGAAGVTACNLALVTDGGRGYYVGLYVSADDPRDAAVYDDTWFSSVLETMQLHPEDAVDSGA